MSEVGTSVATVALGVSSRNDGWTWAIVELTTASVRSADREIEQCECSVSGDCQTIKWPLRCLRSVQR